VIPNLVEDRVRFVLSGKGTEPQAIAQAAIFGSLDLIHVRRLTAGDILHGRQTDRRGRCAQVYHERSGASEAGLLR